MGWVVQFLSNDFGESESERKGSGAAFNAFFEDSLGPSNGCMLR